MKKYDRYSYDNFITNYSNEFAKRRSELKDLDEIEFLRDLKIEYSDMLVYDENKKLYFFDHEQKRIISDFYDIDSSDEIYMNIEEYAENLKKIIDKIIAKNKIRDFGEIERVFYSDEIYRKVFITDTEYVCFISYSKELFEIIDLRDNKYLSDVIHIPEFSFAIQVNHNAIRNMEVSINKIYRFIDQRIRELEDSYVSTDEILFGKELNINKLGRLNWNGTQTELVELIKALIENGSIKGVQKDVINSFSNFLNFEIKNCNKLINDVKKRNNGSETIFLDKLKSSLLDFIAK